MPWPRSNGSSPLSSSRRPGGPDQRCGERFCLQSYVAELDTRFDDGFDPDMSIRAEADDLVPPAGLLLAYAHHWFEKGLTGRHDDTRKGPE